MKKKFETNHIEQYFQVTNNIAPIISEEKVHQIINSPAAKARLKGKPTNILKFTIMTTIFAAILSAVLWWPGGNETQGTRHKTQDKGQENVSSIKYQDTRPMVNDANFTDANGTSSGYADTKNSESNTDNKLMAMANPIESISGFEPKQPNSTVNIIEQSAQPIQQPSQKTIGFDPDTIKPTDGSRFILKLSNEELRKIGFEITDTSYSYKQQIDTTVFMYGFYINKRRPCTFSQGKMIVHEDQPLITVGHTEYGFDSYVANYKLFTEKYDFYPVYKSNTFYSDVVNNEKIRKEEFRLANDTLLPVLLPLSKLRTDSQDQIIWFTSSEKFYSALLPKHKAIVDEFKKYKAAKQAFPSKDLIIYQPPKLFDESKIVTLSKSEMIKLGFKFSTDTTTFEGGFKNVWVRYDKTAVASCSSTSKEAPIEKDNRILAVMVTRTDGSPYASFADPVKLLEIGNGKYGSQFPLLIPVLMKTEYSFFKEDVIFWFYPTDELFKALPTKIGKSLRKEYDYVVAEDKSKLVQPECNYFDECKNTLKVSSFKVYPNPVSANATVSFTLPEAIDGRITLVDLAGRERQVLKPQTSYGKGQHSISVDLNNVPEGIYLLTLYTNKGVQTQRIIVER